MKKLLFLTTQELIIRLKVLEYSQCIRYIVTKLKVKMYVEL